MEYLLILWMTLDAVISVISYQLTNGTNCQSLRDVLRGGHGVRDGRDVHDDGGGGPTQRNGPMGVAASSKLVEGVRILGVASFEVRNPKVAYNLEEPSLVEPFMEGGSMVDPLAVLVLVDRSMVVETYYSVLIIINLVIKN